MTKKRHNREPLDELISTHSWLRRKAKSHRRKAASAAMQRADRQPQAEPSSPLCGHGRLKSAEQFDGMRANGAPYVKENL